MKILATGFGRFPGARRNPTAWLMCALAKERKRLLRFGIELEAAVLPVSFAAIDAKLRQLDETLTPGAILHFGLAGHRKFFSIETRALNRVSRLRADAAGELAPSRVIIADTPFALSATFPYREIEAALRKACLPCRLSINAGSYLCNETLYLSLARSQAPVIGFIHVPRLKRTLRPAKISQKWRPLRGDLVRAAMIAILLVARKLRHVPGVQRGRNGTMPPMI